VPCLYNGTYAEADIAIGAGGINSSVRDFLVEHDQTIKELDHMRLEFRRRRFLGERVAGAALIARFSG
jgi:hypothetical protein